MNKTFEVQRFMPRVTRRNFVQIATSLGISSSLTSFSALAQVRDNKPINLSEVLAQFAASLRFEALSEDVVHLAKLALLDTIGCAIGAYSAQPSKIAIELAEQGNRATACDRTIEREQDQP